LLTIPLLAATCLTGFAMQSFVWFWLKQWIRLRYSSVPSIRPDRLQKILAMHQAGDWLVLDARTTAEFNVSCLPGAVFIDDGCPASTPLAVSRQSSWPVRAPRLSPATTWGRRREK